MSVLAARPELMKRVFVAHSEEHGVYAIRFYRAGAPKVMCVDSYIPCSKQNQPVFASSKNKGIMWPGLLEKAYAKFHGSYDAIIAGFVTDGLSDLTGGFPEFIDLGDVA